MKKIMKKMAKRGCKVYTPFGKGLNNFNPLWERWENFTPLSENRDV